MRSWRFALFILPVLAAFYLLLIAVAYRYPPLTISGITPGHFATPILGMAVQNNAPWAIRLSGYSVREGDLPVSVHGVASRGPRLAFHLVGYAPLTQMEHRPLTGWRVEPEGRREESTSYAVRLEWAEGAQLPNQVFVHYRYLGWPMKARFAGGIAWAMPADPMPPVYPINSALARLCDTGEPATVALRTEALNDITRLVVGAKGDPKLVQQFLTSVASTKAEPMALQADVDSDGQADMLVAFGNCGAPLLVYRAANPQQPMALPVFESFSWAPGQGHRIDRVADVTGDGRPELVVEQNQMGASAVHTWLHIYNWSGAGFVSRFVDDLSNWRGENRWAVGNGTLCIQCRPLGLFEQKLSPSRQQTESFRWNAISQAYDLVDRQREPVTTRLQQVADAEELFQAGTYEDALVAFQQVGRLPAERGPDWVAFAHLRIAQIHALAGRRPEAEEALAQAATGGAPVGEMAQRFRDAYLQGDAADGFSTLWAWIKARPAILADEEAQLLADRHLVGARRAMEAAYRVAGRPWPADLPEARTIKPPACLQIDF